MSGLLLLGIGLLALGILMIMAEAMSDQADQSGRVPLSVYIAGLGLLLVVVCGGYYGVVFWQRWVS